MKTPLSLEKNSLNKNTPKPWLLGDYHYSLYRKIGFLGFLLVLLCVLFFLDIYIGYYEISSSEILLFFFQADQLDSKLRMILKELRIPLALMAIIIGAMLGLAGAQMQSILRNPLADPFTLGISSAASFGAALSIVMPYKFRWMKEFFISGNAFFFGFSTCIFIYFISRFKGVSNKSITLLGIALFFLFSSLTSILKYVSNEFEIQAIVFWTMGSFAAVTWTKIIIASILLVTGFTFFFFYQYQLTILSLGEFQAKNLGISIDQLKMKALFFISLLASTSVAFVGIIGFIGLASPHIARFTIGEDHRFFTPASTILGGILLSFSSIVSKSLFSGVIIPIGIISALLGTPIFIYFIFKQKEEFLL